VQEPFVLDRIGGGVLAGGDFEWTPAIGSPVT